MATITLSMASTPLTASKTFTGTDADMQAIIDWAKVAFDPWIQATFNPSHTPGFTASNAQVGAALANSFMSGIKDAVQRFKTVPAVVPSPISMS